THQGLGGVPSTPPWMASISGVRSVGCAHDGCPKVRETRGPAVAPTPFAATPGSGASSPKFGARRGSLLPFPRILGLTASLVLHADVVRIERTQVGSIPVTGGGRAVVVVERILHNAVAVCPSVGEVVVGVVVADYDRVVVVREADTTAIAGHGRA